MKSKRFFILFILGISLILLGCSSEENQNQNQTSLLDEWQLVSISNFDGSMSTTEDERIVITFLTEDSFSGMTLVNSFSGVYNTSESVLRITEFLTTEVAENGFGADFYIALDRSRVEPSNTIEYNFEIDSNNLTLSNSNVTLSLRRE